MFTILSKFLTKAGEILSTLGGWLTAAALFLLNLFCEYVAGFETILFIVIFATFVDAGWGLARAIKLKEQTTSAMMRGTAAKLAVYGSLLLVFIGLDHVIRSEDGITTIAASSIIILVEVWSIIGNAIIVYPNMPFANLLKKWVSGEIAAKLRCSENEVEDMLNNTHNEKVHKPHNNRS